MKTLIYFFLAFCAVATTSLVQANVTEIIAPVPSKEVTFTLTNPSPAQYQLFISEDFNPVMEAGAQLEVTLEEGQAIEFKYKNVLHAIYFVNEKSKGTEVNIADLIAVKKAEVDCCR